MIDAALSLTYTHIRAGAHGGRAEGSTGHRRGSVGAFVSGCQRSVFAAMHSCADITMPCPAYPSSMQDPDIEQMTI
eukprot:236018-Pelagomonas_calceolata.AAC.1